MLTILEIFMHQLHFITCNPCVSLSAQTCHVHRERPAQSHSPQREPQPIRIPVSVSGFTDYVSEYHCSSNTGYAYTIPLCMIMFALCLAANFSFTFHSSVITLEKFAIDPVKNFRLKGKLFLLWSKNSLCFTFLDDLKQAFMKMFFYQPSTFILSHLIFCFLVSFLLPSLEDVLSALQGVIGRRHPSTSQTRQLKHTLPKLSVVLELLLSQVTWTKERFLSGQIIRFQYYYM